MTQAFRPNGNAGENFAIADDSTNYTAVLNCTTGSYGSALWITNTDVANVVWVNAGWDQYNSEAIVPAPGTPGQGLPVLPASSVILSIPTTAQASGSHGGQQVSSLYFSAAVTGTAVVTVTQGSVN